jgi:hypothetical protein
MIWLLAFDYYFHLFASIECQSIAVELVFVLELMAWLFVCLVHSPMKVIERN